MRIKVIIEVYKDNKLYSNDWCILKYEGHSKVLKDIYKRHGYNIIIKDKDNNIIE